VDSAQAVEFGWGGQGAGWAENRFLAQVYVCLEPGAGTGREAAD
jgi:hypothetical protein